MTTPTHHSRGLRAPLSLLLCSLLLCTACTDAKRQEPAPQLDVLQLLPASGTLQVGETATLGALRLKGGSSQNVTSTATWSSADDRVATVAYDAERGAQVRAVSPGRVRIEASADGATGGAEFVVIAELAAVELDKGLFELPRGTSRPLGAILIASDNSKREPTAPATWGSSDPGVAEVDADGVVTAVGEGEATITLVYEGRTTSRSVQVGSYALESATLEALDGNTLPLGASTTVAITGAFAGGHSEDITSLFQLEIEAAAAASADAEPLLALEGTSVTAGTTAGSATLTATGNPESVAAGQTLTLKLTVSDAPLRALELDAPSSLAALGEVAPFELTGVYGTDLRFPTRAEFTTEPGGIVYVDAENGTLSPLAPGKVTITASVPRNDDAESDAEPIEVSRELIVSADALGALTIERPAGTASPLRVGDTVTLIARAAFGTSHTEDVASAALWTSDQEQVAVVSNVQGGQLTALSPGTATISARYKGASATLQVSVAAR